MPSSKGTTELAALPPSTGCFLDFGFVSRPLTMSQCDFPGLQFQTLFPTFPKPSRAAGCLGHEKPESQAPGESVLAHAVHSSRVTLAGYANTVPQFPHL